MPAHQQHWIRTAFLSGSTGTVGIGKAVVSNGTAYVVATTANRASYGRTQGITLSAGDDDDRAIEIQSTGVLLTEVSGLGAGTESWVRVTALGALERCTPASGNDLVGTCNERGDVFLDLGKWSDANYAGGGGGGGGGDASYPIDLTDGAEVDVPAAGLISSDGTALASVTTSAGVAALISDETGTGALVFANTPTFVTPVIGAATGTSLVVSSFLTVTGGGTQATSGNVRLSNESQINWWNGSATLRGIYFSNSQINIGGDAGADAILLDAVTSLSFALGGASKARITSAGFQLNDSSGGQYLTFSMPNLVADRTLSIPLLTGNDTMVTEAFIQTLTNKTISLTSNTLTFTSAELRTACSDETGTGVLVFGTSPNFTTSIAVGTAAASGSVRLPNNGFVNALEQDGSGDISVIGANTSNQVVVGSLSNPGEIRILAATGKYIASLAPTHYWQTEGAANILVGASTGIAAHVGLVCKTSAMGALAIDWALGNTFTKTLASGGNTLTFSNDADGQTIIVVLTSNGGGSTVTWPAAVKWTGGTEPTQTSTGIDVYTLTKAGSTVYGSYVQNFS